MIPAEAFREDYECEKPGLRKLSSKENAQASSDVEDNKALLPASYPSSSRRPGGSRPWFLLLNDFDVPTNDTS